MSFAIAHRSAGYAACPLRMMRMGDKPYEDYEDLDQIGPACCAAVCDGFRRSRADFRWNRDWGATASACCSRSTCEARGCRRVGGWLLVSRCRALHMARGLLD